MKRGTIRKFSLGRLAYQFGFRPLGIVQRSMREGGPRQQRQTRDAEIAMRAAAIQLAPLVPPPEGPFAEIAFLSGPKYWHQTVFCFVSLQSVCPFCITPVIYDDGGMDADTIRKIRRVIPWAKFVTAIESELLLDAIVPTLKYPALRERRRAYPHLRKLLDIHVNSSGYRLVADSDMLFFREPREVISWFQFPRAFYIQDVATAYGYPLPFLSGLAGALVPEPVNVGLYALNGRTIDWERVEHWCRVQNDVFGPSYLQEQALTAMLFAGIDAVALPREDYIVMPTDQEGETPTAALHHYVDLSKRSYFRHGWRRIMAQIDNQAER